ncbi:hypothetical protein GGR58DRAFT_525474 [Xylaria digitata]|nr:hypothetical protein GGR58DRAFT_525474 [Xylaria digitata]
MTKVHPMIEFIMHQLDWQEEDEATWLKTNDIWPSLSKYSVAFTKNDTHASRALPLVEAVICHATRVQAIKRYGHPSPNTLPFDPSVDSIGFQVSFASQDTLLPQLNKPRFSHWLACGRIDEKLGSTMNSSKQLSSDFLDRVQSVELEFRKISDYKAFIPVLYLQISKNMPKFKLNIGKPKNPTSVRSRDFDHYIGALLFFEVIGRLSPGPVEVAGV